MPLSYFRRPVVLLTILYAGMLACLRAYGMFRLNYPEAAAEWIHEPCVRMEGRVISGLTENRIGPRVRVRATTVTGECGGPESSIPEAQNKSRLGFDRTHLQILTYLPKTGGLAARLWPGQRVAFDGRMRLPRWPRNPGEFDEQELLSDQAISFVFYARQAEILDSGIPVTWWPAYWSERIHRSIHRLLLESYPQEVAGILEGMLLGYKGVMDAQTHRSIQDAGVMHLLVPSGAKVALVILFLYWAASAIGSPPKFRFIVTALIAGFYVLVVGGDPPYVRSYLGMLVLGSAHWWERETQGFEALVLSALAVMAVHPRDLFAVGFQMSYLVVLGVLIAMPRNHVAWKLPRALSWMLKTLWISFVAQLMLLPILAGTFGRFSVIGVFANVLLVPGSIAIFATGFAYWALSFFPFSSLLAIVSGALESLTLCFEWLCVYFAGLPGAAFDAAPFAWHETILYYTLVFGILVLPRWRISAVVWLAAGLVILSMRIWQAAAGSNLQCIFLSQSGHRAAVARLPFGRNILIDAGTRPSMTIKALHAMGIRRLDAAFILSHDRASLAGSEIAQRISVRHWYVVPTIHIRGISAANYSAVTTPLTKEFYRYWDGVSISARCGSVEAENGCALSLQFGRIVLRIGESAAVSVHGSTVPQPEFCIIEPSPEAAPETCLAARSFDVNRDGAVWITSDGKNYDVTSEKQLHALGHPFSERG